MFKMSYGPLSNIPLAAKYLLLETGEIYMIWEGYLYEKKSI